MARSSSTRGGCRDGRISDLPCPEPAADPAREADGPRDIAQSTPEEHQGLSDAVLPHDQRITDWLDAFGQGAAMTDEAAAFMYMRLAIEEMPKEMMSRPDIR